MESPWDSKETGWLDKPIPSPYRRKTTVYLQRKFSKQDFGKMVLHSCHEKRENNEKSLNFASFRVFRGENSLL